MAVRTIKRLRLRGFRVGSSPDEVVFYCNKRCIYKPPFLR